MKSVYQTLGFKKFHLTLSTRPERSLGSDEMWIKAEKALESVLDASGLGWTLNPGDGAFYGPKIDVTVQDALMRQHQCATIQLDFQVFSFFFSLSISDLIVWDAVA